MLKVSLLLIISCFFVESLFGQFNPQTSDKKALSAYNKALVAQNAKNFQSAWDQYQVAINRDPNFAEAYFRKAQVAQAMDNTVDMLFPLSKP
jgi:tetratricopeptide (TPR) repeat protein